MNEAFLAQVARHYYEQYGSSISQLRFIFPSKRALTFFRHYLGKIAQDRPIFSPRLETIGNFIASLVPSVQLLDKTALLFELYEAYHEVRTKQGTPQESIETFDSFLYWGGLILKDFDSCDRYLVNTTHLYSNLSDLKELSDDFSYLSEEARDLLLSFWGNLPTLTSQNTEKEAQQYKARFLSFWESLAPLYVRFNDRLQEQGLTYEGSLYRQASNDKEEILDKVSDPIVFVGLFQLTPAERRIFRTLTKAGKAEFCWDSSVAIVQDPEHPASRYYKQLISEFGQVQGSWIADPRGNYLPDTIDVIQAPSLLAQVKGLPSIFQALKIKEQAEQLQAALVLPDESLLLPTGSSIPDNIGAVNITLGYPLDKTPIALLLRRWIALLEFGLRRHQGKSYPADQLLALLGHRLLASPETTEAMKMIRGQKRFHLPVATILEKHNDPLLHLLLDPIQGEKSSLGEELLDRIEGLLHFFIEQIPATTETEIEGVQEQALSSPSKTSEDKTESSPLSSFDIEFIHHYLRLVTRLRGLITSYQKGAELSSIVHLLDGLVSTVTIPFEGDPLEGLQVMGLLETRSLHFDTMIYLSAQEGSLPSTRFTDSLIPFTLRRAFGLPIDGEDDLGADYTFFQSIAQARQLVFIVAPASEASALGEESRYISLLEYIYHRPITRRTLRLSSDLVEAPPRIIAKEGEAWETFVKRSMTDPTLPEGGGKSISPSALAKFVQCPLRFYYDVVCRLKEEEEPSILLASNKLGTIVHAVLESLYKQELKATSIDLRSGTIITEERLTALLKDKRRITNSVEKAYREEMLLGSAPLSNLARIYCRTIEQYVRAVLEADLRYTPFEYIAGEESLSLPFQLSDGRRIYIGGIIDRIDKKEGIYRIVDYKTGQAALKASTWDKLLDPQYKAILQTLIYCEIYQRDKLDQVSYAYQLHPAIYRFNNSGGLLQQKENYDPILHLPTADDLEQVGRGGSKPRSYQEVEAPFTELLTTQILDRLFDAEEPFVQTDNPDNCSYCPFALSCGR